MKEQFYNVEYLQELRDKGLSYGSIGKIVGVSRQRIHVLLSGYKSPDNLNKDLVKIREYVFERDKNTCQKCKGIGTTVHHIDHNDRNNSFDNLILLCNNCHLDLHRPKELSPKFKYGGTGKDSPNWKGGIERMPKCMDCGKRLSRLSAKRCPQCWGIEQKRLRAIK